MIYVTHWPIFQETKRVFRLFSGVLDMTATENSIRVSVHTKDKVTKAKVTLENYYSNLIAQHVERKQRYVQLTLIIVI